jgi:hypothetical protein
MRSTAVMPDWKEREPTSTPCFVVPRPLARVLWDTYVSAERSRLRPGYRASESET